MSDLIATIQEQFNKFVEKVRPPVHVSILDANESIANLVKGFYNTENVLTMTDVIDHAEAQDIAIELGYADWQGFDWYKDVVHDELQLRASIGRQREIASGEVAKAGLGGFGSQPMKERGLINQVKEIMGSRYSDVENPQ